MTQINGPVLKIQGTRFRLFNGDIVINSGDLSRNGANHWQIINLAPQRQTLWMFEVYFRKVEKERKWKKVKEKVSTQDKRTFSLSLVVLSKFNLLCDLIFSFRSFRQWATFWLDVHYYHFVLSCVVKNVWLFSSLCSCRWTEALIPGGADSRGLTAAPRLPASSSDR